MVIFDSNKNIGNSSLGMAIAYFTSSGFVVSIPLNNTQDYDLVVEENKKLFKVQVKGTSFKTKYGVFQVALKSCGGTKGEISNADLLFVVTKNRDFYLIPIKDIQNKYTLNLGSDYEKYRVIF